jgi:hypothetical protein
MHDWDEIERGIGKFAQTPNGGLIVPAGAAAVPRPWFLWRLGIAFLPYSMLRPSPFAGPLFVF